MVWAPPISVVIPGHLWSYLAVLIILAYFGHSLPFVVILAMGNHSGRFDHYCHPWLSVVVRGPSGPAWSCWSSVVTHGRSSHPWSFGSLGPFSSFMLVLVVYDHVGHSNDSCSFWAFFIMSCYCQHLLSDLRSCGHSSKDCIIGSAHIHLYTIVCTCVCGCVSKCCQ